MKISSDLSAESCLVKVSIVSEILSVSFTASFLLPQKAVSCLVRSPLPLLAPYVWKPDSAFILEACFRLHINLHDSFDLLLMDFQSSHRSGSRFTCWCWENPFYCKKPIQDKKEINLFKLQQIKTWWNWVVKKAFHTIVKLTWVNFLKTILLKHGI